MQLHTHRDIQGDVLGLAVTGVKRGKERKPTLRETTTASFGFPFYPFFLLHELIGGEEGLSKRSHLPHITPLLDIYTSMLM